MTGVRAGGSPRFVCVEGIDGAGKTTAVAALGALLRERGIDVAVVDKHDCRFASAYVDGHMTDLRRLIWGHPPEDPYLELGDMHWVHLQVAWYLAVARCAVEPLLAAGTVVLTDTWMHKFLAKLAMRPTVDLEHVRGLLAQVPRPGLVIKLGIDPAVAAARKPVIAVSEAGNDESTVELTRERFVAYQRRLAGVLDRFSRDESWESLDVTSLAVPEVAEALAGLLAVHFPDLPISAGGKPATADRH